MSMVVFFCHAQSYISICYSVSSLFIFVPVCNRSMFELACNCVPAFISAKEFAPHPEASLGTRFILSPLILLEVCSVHIFVSLTATSSVDGVASKTSKNDVIYECERYGKVVSCSLRKCVLSYSLSHVADVLFRSYALVEFKHSDDAKCALKKLDSVRIDGSKWLLDPADIKDFKYFDWTPPSSVFLPRLPEHHLSCPLLLGKRCNGAAGDDISIRLSTTFAVFSSTHTWDPTSLDV